MASLHFISASRYSMIPSLEQQRGRRGVVAVGVKIEMMMNNTCRRKPWCPPADAATGRPPTTNGLLITAAAAAATMVLWVMGANAVETGTAAYQTLSNIPQMLSGECFSAGGQQEECKKKVRIQKPKSRKAESCTIKCVTTCIRGGGGSPGEGPLNVRRPLVVFKQGFRSRQYCLMECSDICNLLREGDDGP